MTPMGTSIMAIWAALAPRLENEDTWVQALDDAELIGALDVALSRACGRRSRRVEDQSTEDDATTTAFVFALYARALGRLKDGSADDATRRILERTLFHISRLLPFCQLYGARNGPFIASLLDTAISRLSELATTLPAVSNLFLKQLQELHEAVGRGRRNEIVELVQSLHEISASLHGLAVSTDCAELIFAESAEPAALIRALAECYESDVPKLQCALSKLDDRAQRKVAILIPEARQLLLTILSAYIVVVMKREKKSKGTGETLLSILHELSHCTEADGPDHGSFISDLWHVHRQEATILQYFRDMELDSDSISYLEVVVDGLPKRRLVDEYATTEAQSETTQPASSSNDDTSAQPDLMSEIAQVKDLFPDLGDGFVALCLLSTNRQVESVINFLLEGNPPPVLLKVRRDLGRHDAEFESFERQVLGVGPPQPSSSRTEKIDPAKIWKGKKSGEKQYDPRVTRQNPDIVEKTKQIADEYATEDSFREAARKIAAEEAARTDLQALGGDEMSTSFIVDEYNDDYNDEFEDYEPFSVHDSGQGDDFDAIREQNRRMRELEAEDAYWESIRNKNRPDKTPDTGGEGDDDLDQETKDDSRLPARKNAPQQHKHSSAAGPISDTQAQRARNRNTKNKAKVANHHRKERALKKRG